MRTIVFCLLLVAGCADGGGLRPPDVRYEPSAMDVVQVMLDLGAIGPQDMVADLGCGDGRIVIEAVRRYGASGVCVDIDPERIAEARANAQAAGVAERIRFLNQDLFATELRGVTVVMLFLSPQLNLALRSKLRRELGPGARIVSHWQNMGDWTPDRTVNIRSGLRERPVYLWVIRG